MSVSVRCAKVGKNIQIALSEVLKHMHQLEGAFIGISLVNIAPDLRNATIFVHKGDEYIQDNSPHCIVKKLNTLKPQIRYLLTQRLKLRYSPDLHFKYDNSFDTAANIENILIDYKRAES